MSEPKYELNAKDGKRWHDLLVRHCLETPDLDGKVKRHKKYPPLTPEENVEFEALSRKRERKHAAHPAAKEALRRVYARDRKIQRLLADLKRLTKKWRREVAQAKKVKIKVDSHS